MDAYVNILSPLDFNFPPFSPTHSSNDPLALGINSNHSQQLTQPLSPAYAKPYQAPRQQPSVVENGQTNFDLSAAGMKELYELLDGHGLESGSTSFNPWMATTTITQYAQRQNPSPAQLQTPAHTPFQRHPHLVTYPRPPNPSYFSSSPQASVLSDSPFTASSSSSLSSQTCSPWETCPGLAPISPQVFPSTIAGLRQARGLNGASSMTAVGENSLGLSAQGVTLSQPGFQLHGSYYQQQQQPQRRKRSLEELAAGTCLSLDTSMGLGLNLGTDADAFFNQTRSGISGFDEGNSFEKMTLQSPIQLTFESPRREQGQNFAQQNVPSPTGVSCENVGFFMNTQPAVSSPMPTISKASPTGINPAQTQINSAPALQVVSKDNKPFQISSPLTPMDDKRENALPPISPLSPPESPHRGAQPSSAGTEHRHSPHRNNSLFSRSVRRKVSKVNYAIDTLDSGSDGDYEFDDQDYDGDDDDLNGDATKRSPKRRKRSASAGETNQRVSGAASPNGGVKKARKVQSYDEMQQSSTQAGDSDDEFISVIEDQIGASPTPDNSSTNSSPSCPSTAPRPRTSSKSKAKPKSKRRHHCPRSNCHASFTRITDMERHLASVHRTKDDGEVNEACRCAFCGKMFSREDAVLRHENDSCPVRVKRRRW